LNVQKLGIALQNVSANFSGGAKLADADLSITANAFQVLKLNDMCRNDSS
jgi:hypothetical protein